LRTIEAIAERRHAAKVRRALRHFLRQCVSVHLDTREGRGPA
jgi:hypothetical protein